MRIALLAVCIGGCAAEPPPAWVDPEPNPAPGGPGPEGLYGGVVLDDGSVRELTPTDDGAAFTDADVVVEGSFVAVPFEEDDRGNAINLLLLASDPAGFHDLAFQADDDARFEQFELPTGSGATDAARSATQLAMALPGMNSFALFAEDEPPDFRDLPAGCGAEALAWTGAQLWAHCGQAVRSLLDDAEVPLDGALIGSGMPAARALIAGDDLVWLGEAGLGEVFVPDAPEGLVLLRGEQALVVSDEVHCFGGDLVDPWPLPGEAHAAYWSARGQLVVAWGESLGIWPMDGCVPPAEEWIGELPSRAVGLAVAEVPPA